MWIFYVFFCLVFAMPLCVSVYRCFVVTCWERADFLALVCDVLLWVCHFPIGILGQVWYFNVSIPDLGTLTYFTQGHNTVTLVRLEPTSLCLESSTPPLSHCALPRSGTIYSILEEGVIGNIYVKLFEIGTVSGSGDVIWRKSLRMTDWPWTKIDHNSLHWAFGSGELKVDYENKQDSSLKDSQIVRHRIQWHWLELTKLRYGFYTPIHREERLSEV